MSEVRALRRRGKVPAWLEREVEAIPGWTWRAPSPQLRQADDLRAFVERQRRRRGAPADVTSGLVTIARWLRAVRRPGSKALSPRLRTELRALGGL